MTMRYAHLSPEARESAVQELDGPVPSRASLWARETSERHTRAHAENEDKEEPSNPLRVMGF